MTHEEFVRRVELAVQEAEGAWDFDENLEMDVVFDALIDELKALLAEEAE